MSKAEPVLAGELDLELRIERALQRARWVSSDHVLRDMFEENTADADRRSLRLGMRGAVTCFISFGLFDLWLFQDTGLNSLLVRLVVGLLFLAIVELQFLRGSRLRTLNIICATSLAVAALAWLIVAGRTAYQDYFGHFMVFGTIFVISSSLFFRFGLTVSAVCSSLITLFFSVAAAKADLPLGTRLVIISYFVSFLGFSLYLSWQLSAERYIAFLNATRAKLNEAVVREKSQQLALIANTDHLTGLKNRRAVVQEYAEHRDRWLRLRQPIGVILIDVDHFKAFNDHYGHQSGDRCLVEVGQALELAAARAGGVLGRYGGEEFMAFCHVRDEGELKTFSESMRRAVENVQLPHIKRPDGYGVVTVSIGATLTRENTNPELDRLSGEADKALYVAKAGGRNCIRIFDPMAPLIGKEDDRITEILKQAIDQGLVSFVYQPIFDMRDGSLYAAEALMRLQAPDGTSISPSVFIPVAERTGLIIELGRWALRRACADVLSKKLADRVSVNVSAVQLRASGFPLFVARLLSEYRLPPSALALEITEGVDISSDSQILQAILSLQQLGVQIWLDDFGTGYAGLAWLRLIDFDVVKIDRRFLHSVETHQGALFMQDVLRLLRNHGVSIVIEGLETEEQAEFLQRNDAMIAQGYLLCRPIPSSHLAASVATFSEGKKDKLTRAS